MQNEPKMQIIPVGLFPENDETYAGTDELCQKLSYSGTPPYDHPVYKTTSLLRPYSFKPNVKTIESFYYFDDPVNATTSLLRPGFYGPTVVALTGFHCNTIYLRLKVPPFNMIFACVFFSFHFQLIVKNPTAVFSPDLASSEGLNFGLQNTILRSKGMPTIPGRIVRRPQPRVKFLTPVSFSFVQSISSDNFLISL